MPAPRASPRSSPYSRTTDQNDDPLSVLMGCSYHVAHEFEGQETTGRGFFAHTKVIPDRGTRYDAFTGAEADEIAEALGMDRAEGDIGTTIAIIDCDLQIDDIARGVEHSWWPRILRDVFRVELRDETGKKVIPRPKLNKQILPYWEAFEVALGKTLPAKGRSKLTQFSRTERTGGLALGQLGLVVMQDPGATADEGDDDDAVLSSVALIRSPGMVVRYHQTGRMGFPPVAGAFVADDEIDMILRRSEPPKHDEWDEKAGRLRSDIERTVVKDVKDRSWRALREFQKNAQPPKASNGTRISELERLLGKLLGPSALKPPSGDGKHETPISLKSKVSARPQGSDLVATGRVELALAKNARPQTVWLSIALRAVDESGRMTDPVALSLSSGAGLDRRDGALAGAVTLEENESFVFEVESAPYDRDWTLSFVPTVTPMDEAEGETA
ncbi:MAG: hypothetical protein R3D85_10885 [Paracoccaceae bacterium]